MPYENVSTKQIKDDWIIALMANGLIVKLNISRWTGNKNLSADLLGIKHSDDSVADFMREYINLGTHKLLPNRINAELLNIYTKAKKNLESYSFDTVWGSFVPNTAFDAWKEENDKIKKEYYGAALVLSNRYDEIVSAIKIEYKKLAKDVWKRLYPDSNSGPTEAFESNFINNIASYIPSRSKILSSFIYKETYFTIPMPSIVEKDLLLAEEIKNERTLAQYKLDLQRQTYKRLNDEYASKKREFIDGFIDATIKTLRHSTEEICESVISQIKSGNNKVNTTLIQVKKVKGMIKKIRLLNFYDDQKMNELLRSLEIEVDKFKGERSDEAIIDKLQNVVMYVRQEIIPPNFAQDIDQPDI